MITPQVKAWTETAVFQIGETVFSAIASDERGMVTGIVLRASYCLYYVTWASDLNESLHEPIELSREPLYQQATR